MIFSHMTGFYGQFVKLRISNYNLILYGKIKSELSTATTMHTDALKYLDDFDANPLLIEYLKLEFQERKVAACQVLMTLTGHTEKYQASRIFLHPSIDSNNDIMFMIPGWRDPQRFQDWIDMGGYYGMSEADRLLWYIDDPKSKVIVNRMLALEIKVKDHQKRMADKAWMQGIFESK